MAEGPTTPARSFGGAADRYDRWRPPYPIAAVRWALGERLLRVVDLGAGTGILSRLLHQLGHQVVAVEPDELMLRRLTEVSNGITALAGAAEEIPLADESADAVTAGQAYHWFDPDRAHAEIARVLRPGGAFATLRNDADPAVAWAGRFDAIIDGARDEAEWWRTASFGPRFGPVATAHFRHEVRVLPADLVTMATTRSPYLTASPAGRRELLAAVRRLAEGPELGRREAVAMPYLAEVRRAVRL